MDEFTDLDCHGHKYLLSSSDAFHSRAKAAWMIYRGGALGSMKDPGKRRSQSGREGTIETSGRARQQRQPEVAYMLSKKQSNNGNGGQGWWREGQAIIT